MNHLTDDQLQTWLESTNAISLNHIREHLARCSSCRKHLILYKQLYKGLEQRQPLCIPCNFADKVMAHLPAHSARKKHALREKFGWIITGLSGCLCLSYFIDWRDLLSCWKQSIRIGINISETLWISVQKVLNVFDGAVVWLLAGAFILMTMMIFDKCLKIKHPNQLLYH